jgi:hypothetical protein
LTQVPQTLWYPDNQTTTLTNEKDFLTTYIKKWPLVPHELLYMTTSKNRQQSLLNEHCSKQFALLFHMCKMPSLNLTFWQTFPTVFLSAVNTHELMLKQIIIIPSSNTLFNSPFNITPLLNTTQPTLRKKFWRSCTSLLDKSNCWLFKVYGNNS